LQSNAVPVNGSYDLTFSLYANNSGGTSVAGPLTNTATTVNDGVFYCAVGFRRRSVRWHGLLLEIGVRTNGDADFTILSPRQELTATPYAVYAENARAGGDRNPPAAVLRGTYDNAMTLTNPGNTFAGDGTGLTNVNAVTLGWVRASGISGSWAAISASSGAFLARSTIRSWI